MNACAVVEVPGKKRGLQEENGDNSEATGDEEDRLDLEAEVIDSGKQATEPGDTMAINFQAEKSGKRAVSDNIEEPVDPDIYVVVLVDGEVKGEGLGNHIRAARREAARKALEGDMARFVQATKQQVANQSSNRNKETTFRGGSLEFHNKSPHNALQRAHYGDSSGSHGYKY